jgi:chromate transporter
MPPAEPISLVRAARTWAKIGLLGFGGPAGQIALMHRLLVDERWISEERFLHALKFCTLLPGPEAQQLATYVGWLLHGVRGGLVAGALFVLPGAVILLGLSWIYFVFGSVPLIGGIFVGLKAAVLAIVIQAVLRLSRRALPTGGLRLVAVLAFLALAAWRVPFPLVVLGAGIIGALVLRPSADATGAEPEGHEAGPLFRRTVVLAATGLLLWWIPVAALALAFGARHVFAQLGLFFSQAAVVTFGGAYAVLAYVAQRAVSDFGWLATPEMVDGLGLAETTPGPLILVLQFVGFLAGSRAGPPVDGLLGGLLGSAITLWVTFVPSVLFVLAGAPFMERLRQRPLLTGALTAITAAVVGVVAQLALWFALHTLFAQRRLGVLGPASVELPVWGSAVVPSCVLSVAALVLVFGFRLGVGPVLGATAVLGVMWRVVAD